jgi:hypothetical protein
VRPPPPTPPGAVKGRGRGRPAKQNKPAGLAPRPRAGGSLAAAGRCRAARTGTGAGRRGRGHGGRAGPAARLRVRAGLVHRPGRLLPTGWSPPPPSRGVAVRRASVRGRLVRGELPNRCLGDPPGWLGRPDRWGLEVGSSGWAGRPLHAREQPLVPGSRWTRTGGGGTARRWQAAPVPFPDDARWRRPGGNGVVQPAGVTANPLTTCATGF